MLQDDGSPVRVEIHNDDEVRVTVIGTDTYYGVRGLPALLRAAADWHERQDAAVVRTNMGGGLVTGMTVLSITYENDWADGESLTISWTV